MAQQREDIGRSSSRRDPDPKDVENSKKLDDQWEIYEMLMVRVLDDDLQWPKGEKVRDQLHTSHLRIPKDDTTKPSKVGSKRPFAYVDDADEQSESKRPARAVPLK